MTMLKVESLESGYGPMQVLWQPSLEVRKGSITSLLGPNGVGKSISASRWRRRGSTSSRE
jgi:ABC-type branched-subunit amino acid transport system ATPase component